MAQDISEASYVGRNHLFYGLLDQLMELEGKGSLYLLFSGFQVPDRCRTEELKRPLSPTIAALMHNQQH